jgi:hypothetical protein
MVLIGLKEKPAGGASGWDGINRMSVLAPEADIIRARRHVRKCHEQTRRFRLSRERRVAPGNFARQFGFHLRDVPTEATFDLFRNRA